MDLPEQPGDIIEGKDRRWVAIERKPGGWMMRIEGEEETRFVSNETIDLFPGKLISSRKNRYEREVEPCI